MRITKDEFKNKIIELNISLQTDRKALSEQLLELINLLDQEDLHEDFAKLLSGEFVINSINNETFNLIAALRDYIKTRGLFPLAIFSLIERMESLGLLKDKLYLLDPLMEHLGLSILKFVFNENVIQKLEAGDFSGWQDALNPDMVLGRYFHNGRLIPLFFDDVIFKRILNALITAYEKGLAHPNNILLSLQTLFQLDNKVLNLSLLFGQYLTNQERLIYLNLLKAIAQNKDTSLVALATLLNMNPAIAATKDGKISDRFYWQNLGVHLFHDYRTLNYGVREANFLRILTFVEIIESVLSRDLSLNELIRSALIPRPENSFGNLTLKENFIYLLHESFPDDYDLIYRLAVYNLFSAEELILAGYSQADFADFLIELAKNLVKDGQRKKAIDVLSHALKANNELGEFFLSPEKGKSPSIENVSTPLGKLYQCLAKLDIASALTCKKNIEGAKTVEFLSKLKESDPKTTAAEATTAKTAAGRLDETTMLLGLLAKEDDEDHSAAEAPAKLSMTKSGLQ